MPLAMIPSSAGLAQPPSGAPELVVVVLDETPTKPPELELDVVDDASQPDEPVLLADVVALGAPPVDASITVAEQPEAARTTAGRSEATERRSLMPPKLPARLEAHTLFVP
jgi:hypothetical protein